MLPTLYLKFSYQLQQSAELTTVECAVFSIYYVSQGLESIGVGRWSLLIANQIAS